MYFVKHLLETVPKKSEKCFLENQLETKSLIVLKPSIIYRKHWALNNYFIWPLISLIKKNEFVLLLHLVPSFFGTVSINEFVKRSIR